MSSADAARNRRAAQERIRRRCKCGRVIVGNAGWSSHLRANDGDPGHGFGGRA